MNLLRHALPLALSALCLPACIIELDGDLAETIEGHIDASCIGGDARSESFTIEEPIHAVVVDGGVGNVTVRSHAEPGVRGEADLFADGGRAEPILRVEDGVLHVGVDCSGRGCCGADFSLVIPTAADLEVGLGVGDVDVADISGLVTIDVGTGDIELDALGGRLGLNTGTGSIEGKDLRGSEVVADIGTGDIMLRYDDDAPLEMVRVDLGVGAVELSVPGGGYALDLDRGVGDMDVSGIDDRDDSGRRIHVDVGTGDIEIRGL